MGQDVLFDPKADRPTAALHRCIDVLTFVKSRLESFIFEEDLHRIEVREASGMSLSLRLVMSAMEEIACKVDSPMQLDPSPGNCDCRQVDTTQKSARQVSR